MAKINKNIIFLGIVSLLTDISSEMIFPILPVFLDHFLKATKFEIGIIEGTAQLVASFLKVFSGHLSDRVGKKKPIIVAGYLLSTVSKPFLYFAAGWKDVLLLRVIERTGKGIRTAPRDALISAYTTQEKSGRAFGIHRGMDTLGAVLGSLSAFVIILFLGETESSFRLIFLISFFPAFLAVIVLLFFVKEKPFHPVKKRSFRLKDLPVSYYWFLFFQGIFMLFSMNYAFMILKSSNVGVSLGYIPVVYILFNVVYAVFSYPFGLWADRFGKVETLTVVYLIFSITAFVFTLDTPVAGWIGFVLYGIFMAGYEVITRALISDIVSPQLKGTAYGMFHTLSGITVFLSVVIAGFLWDRFGADVPFYLSSAGSLIISMIIYIKLKNKL